jgi:hypothetical protein
MENHVRNSTFGFLKNIVTKNLKTLVQKFTPTQLVIGSGEKDFIWEE